MVSSASNSNFSKPVVFDGQGPQSGNNLAVGKRRTSLAGLKGLLKFLAPHKVSLGWGCIGLLVGAGMNLLLPELLKRFIDALSAGHPDLRGLVVVTLAVFGVQGVAFYVRTSRFGAVSHRVAGQIRADIYNGVLQRPPTFFDGHRSGDLAARLSSEVQLVQDVLGVRAIVLVRYGLQVVIGTILMGLVSTKLTLALIGALLALVGVGFLFSLSLRRASKALNAEVGTLTGLFTEALSGVKFLQAHRSVTWMTQKLDLLNQVTVDKGEERVGVSASFQSFVSFLLNAALVLLGVYGIALVGNGELSAGKFGAFVSYAAIVAVSFSFLIASISEVSQALGAWERLSELIPDGPHAPTNGSSGPCTTKQDAAPPTIAFDHVNFSYGNSQLVALNDVTFSIAPGQRVALVGRSGAGKSTVLSLLLGLYRPSTGQIRISADGSVSHSLAGRVVYVPQEPQLFGLSVRENLLVTAPDATDGDLRAALTRARLDTVVGGVGSAITLDTVIGERGLSLSSGQRQRLALARAFLSNAKVILLDEPTANLDAENEQAIQAALAELFAGKTTITVAHRFSTIMESDVVLVMEDGRLIEQGAPSALLQAGGMFHHLASLQQQAAGQ